ncbi:exopolysaccharide production protein ExoQ [Loktanella ponticola]|uniref:Exopolysaccharide production protein ExoQ n=1 Tax=Yoonia ponticola TaxID=1524255 RepID=A0A7W9BIN8_9RHOB|nr:O-antigen ligase [Yoonia ponticola]MBB5721272.1 exopolysaccharide production protein ExoQ [Yoonia ponticola]
MSIAVNNPTVPIEHQASHAVEKALVVLWFVVTFTVFKNDELILYALAFYFFYAFVRQRDETIPLLFKCWPLLLLPLWALVSSGFGVVPQVAMRTAVQMILTLQISILIVVWLRPREIILTVLAATGICGVLSVFITSYHDGAMTGIFAHKNMLGAKMLMLWTAALCVALDRWIRLWVRLVAAGMSILAFALILASHSATALVLALAIVGMISTFAFFAGRGRLTPVSRFAFGLILFGIAGLTIPAIASEAGSFVDSALGSLGKSRTLTGRTDLWAYAEDVIRERPWIGHGAGGFWRYEESDLVREIFAEFHKNPNQHFSFHNSFYEITVHFGLIGLALTLFTLVWIYLGQFKQLLLRGGLPFVFFPTIAVVELIRSFVESSLMKPFQIANVLIFIGVILTVKYPLTRGQSGR